MIDPKLILATKVIGNIGVKILIKMPDGKKKWVWRDKVKPKDNAFDELLSR